MQDLPLEILVLLLEIQVLLRGIQVLPEVHLAEEAGEPAEPEEVLAKVQVWVQVWVRVGVLVEHQEQAVVFLPVALPTKELYHYQV
jgi:hypothetical protein